MKAMPERGSAFDSRTAYRIQVQGRVSPDWSDRMEGLSIYTETLGENAVPVTTLQGTLLDQAALFGVLETIYALHLPVISVTRLEDESPGPPVQTGSK